MRRHSGHRCSSSRSRVVVRASVVLALLAVSGTAFAFWAAGGGGTGTAGTEATLRVTLSPGVPTGQLYPGGTADVVLTISNPNAATVRIGSLALDEAQGTGGFSVDNDHAACDLSVLAFTTATNGPAGWSVPGAASGTPGTSAATLSDALSMSVDAADACQGAELTVHVAAGP